MFTDKDKITLTRAQLDALLNDCGCYAAELALELARQLRPLERVLLL